MFISNKENQGNTIKLVTKILLLSIISLSTLDGREHKTDRLFSNISLGVNAGFTLSNSNTNTPSDNSLSYGIRGKFDVYVKKQWYVGLITSFELNYNEKSNEILIDFLPTVTNEYKRGERVHASVGVTTGKMYFTQVNGFTGGLGWEKDIGKRQSVGAEYRYTSLKDNSLNRFIATYNFNF